MMENLFRHIDIDPKNVNILNGNAPDLVAECEAYEHKIAAVGGIELFLAGMHFRMRMNDDWPSGNFIVMMMMIYVACLDCIRLS